MRHAVAEQSKEVAVWMVDGVPVRIVYAGRRWRVNDVPSRITASDVLGDHPAITHLPEWSGWRFQAVDEHGVAMVFDVREGAQGWILLGLYD